MTWEEAGLISKYPEVNERLRAAAARNVTVVGLCQLKEQWEAEHESQEHRPS